MRSVLVFLAVIGLALGLATLAVQPPAPRPADADETSFSAERAMADVRRIGRVAHPTGSAENRHVRDYLVRRLTDMGLEVSTQRGSAVEQRWPAFASGASVENIIAVLPGEDRSAPAILLMSHYDSALGSPGAADDAAGVAASLEAVRALQAEAAPRRRDLVLVITDAEEQGLLGANAFFAAHPLAGRVGAVVNLETRGAAGRAFMFETGRQNGAMMGLFARSVGQPSTTSLATFLYSVLPNDTDFSHPRDRDMQGFNLAFIGEPFHYHSATATPANLNRGSLQHLGGQALDLTRALLAAETLPERRPNVVFSDVFGLFTVVYPAWAGWVFVVVTGLLLAGLVWRSLNRTSVLRVAGVGLIAGLAIAVLAGLVGRGLLLVTGFSTDFLLGRPLLARFGLFETGLVCAGLAAILIGAAVMLRGREDAGDRAEPAAIGLVAFGWLAALSLQILAPEAAILAAWPALAGALAILAARRLGRWALPVSAAIGLIVGGWVLSILHGVYLGVGATMPSAPAALSVFALLPLAPLLARAARGRTTLIVSGVFLVAALVIGGWLRMAPPSPDRPLPTQVALVSDPVEGTAVLAAPLGMDDAWTRGALRSQGGEISEHTVPALSIYPMQVARAEAVTGDAPPSIAISPTPDGRLRLDVSADPSVREVRLTFSPGVRDITVGDLAIEPGAEDEVTVLRWSEPSRGFSVTVAARAGETVRYAAFREGWPAGVTPLPRRGPATTTWGISDSRVLVGELALTPPG